MTACSKSLDTDVEEDGSTQDYSNPTASKVIQSENIEKFTLIFEDDASENYYLNSRCVMELEKTSEGVKMSLSRDNLSKSKIVNKKVLKEFQDIVKNHNVVSINGHNKWNSALGVYFDLQIIYDSGEKITAHGEGGDAVLPDDFNAEWFLDFFCNKLKIKKEESNEKL